MCQDHILDIINTTSGEEAGADDEKEQLAARQKTVDTLSEHYSSSSLATEMAGKIARGGGAPLPEVEGNATGRYATNWCTQFFVLFGRTLKLKFRDPMSFGTVLSCLCRRRIRAHCPSIRRSVRRSDRGTAITA